MSFEKGLLNYVGGVENGPVAQLEMGEKMEIGPKPCQVRSRLFVLAHAGMFRR
jgi:hypothetical protein